MRTSLLALAALALAVLGALGLLLSRSGDLEAHPHGHDTADHASKPPLIVIDPGHGGSNTGTFGAGMHEKYFTLALSRQVRDRLEVRGYRVVLTRNRDVYLTTRQRIHAANRIRADLFVSVHANASASHRSFGYETFVLTPKAIDIDGRALRLADGAERPGVPWSTAILLDDIERGAAQWAAADVAVEMQRQLRALRGREGDRGVRQDAMHVLLGALMPAVLVEVGFLDHPVEGQELIDEQVQAQLAEALAEAVDGYFRSRGRAAVSENGIHDHGPHDHVARR